MSLPGNNSGQAGIREADRHRPDLWAGLQADVPPLLAGLKPDLQKNG
jgi:hypothetical protein